MLVYARVQAEALVAVEAPVVSEAPPVVVAGVVEAAVAAALRSLGNSQTSPT